jgi:hypothetical protein
MARFLRVAEGRGVRFGRSAASTSEVDDRADDKGKDNDPADDPIGGTNTVVGCCEQQSCGRSRVCCQGFKHVTSVTH